MKPMLKKIQRKLNEYNTQYHWLNLAMSIIWIMLMLLDFAGVLRINETPYMWIDGLLWGLFTLDYFGRLILAPNKRLYFRKNIFDLIAILPLNFIWLTFNIQHFGSITRLNRIARIVGLFGKLSRNKRSILYTNGFIYVLYVSLGIIIVGAGLFSVAEGVSFADSLWWAIVTVTTVGYGDLAPQTDAGKMIAAVLMLLGIGFIGILTSTITSYFSRKNDAIRAVQEDSELNELKQELSDVKAQLTRIEQLLSNKK
ncbi:MAG: potassium channel family protein [Enterococcus sp.]